MIICMFRIIFAFALLISSLYANEKAELLLSLEKSRQELKAQSLTRDKIEREIQALQNDKEKLISAGIEAAQKARGFEARVASSQLRLLTLSANEKTIKDNLLKRNDAIAELLAALQRMGKNPTPALLLSPQDAMKAVRSALLLGAVLPEMRQDVEGLQTELAALLKVRRESEVERDLWQKDMQLLLVEQQRLESLADARIILVSHAQKHLQSEKEKVDILARQSQNIESLLKKLEPQPEPLPLLDKKQQMAALSNLGRMSPAVPFSEMGGKLSFPVLGKIYHDYGQTSANSPLDKGITLETAVNAAVTAPADGWVLYAGGFRSYGQLLILNTGQGYNIILAGMEKINVSVGQFVLSGEPIGVMGNSSSLTALTSQKIEQPLLFIEFKKDSITINPNTWFMARAKI